MPTKPIEYKFQPGDLVALKAMVEVQDSEGPPQIFAVVRVRAVWETGGVDVEYFCRPLLPSGSPRRQMVHDSRRFLIGWELFAESELVLYDKETMA